MVATKSSNLVRAVGQEEMKAAVAVIREAMNVFDYGMSDTRLRQRQKRRTLLTLAVEARNGKPRDDWRAR